MTAIRYLAALLLAAAGPVHALNKCSVNGEVVFQDRPCPGAGETVGQALDRQAHYQALERRLDQLQAQGAGLVQRAPPRPASKPQAGGGDRLWPQSWDERQAQRRIEDARIQEQTEHHNAVSAARLTQMGQQMQQACGVDKLPEVPTVGMSDEAFRHCTLLARLGGVTQVVVSEDAGVPLRLYVFPSGKVRRVYSIGGVVTAVKP